MSPLAVSAEEIHPSLWRASQLARGRGRTVDTGYPALSSELPGGGWPLGGLVDLLVENSGIGEMRLLRPALSSIGERSIALVQPLHTPSAQGLQHIGMSPDRVLLVRSSTLTDTLWCVEQVLRAGCFGALAAFLESVGEEVQGIRELIEQYNASKASSLEQELFKQRARLVAAERTLQTRTTRVANESRRIATEKIDATLRRLEDIARAELEPRDSRIFPGYYAPVLIVENGERVIKPMRYQCRIAGKPASYDIKYPGTYNARRDSLSGFWKPCFGYTHGIMVVDVFYENVSRARMEGRQLAAGETDENVVLEFRPGNGQQMFVACLWSRWTASGEPDLLSFAAITDEPPPEIAAAGHDRCIIPIKPEHIDAWLNPDPNELAGQYAILDDRDRPYYEHKLAA